MNGRVVDWEETKLELLKDPKIAKGYIETCLEEGMPLNMALAAVIKAQGVTKIAKKTHMAVPNVLRAVRKSSNPTYGTLQKLLGGVGLGFAVRSLRSQHAKV